MPLDRIFIKLYFYTFLFKIILCNGYTDIFVAIIGPLHLWVEHIRMGIKRKTGIAVQKRFEPAAVESLCSVFFKIDRSTKSSRQTEFITSTFDIRFFINSVRPKSLFRSNWPLQRPAAELSPKT